MDDLTGIVFVVAIAAVPALVLWTLTYFVYSERPIIRCLTCGAALLVPTAYFWPTSLLFAPIALAGLVVVVGALEWAIKADSK